MKEFIKSFLYLIGLFATVLGIKAGCFDDKPLTSKEFQQYKGEIAELNDIPRAKSDSLHARYPLGYAIFYTFIEEMHIFSPNSVLTQQGLKIDWGKASINKYDSNDSLLEITLPDIEILNKDNSSVRLLIRGNQVVIPPKEGLVVPAGFNINNIDCLIEVLSASPTKAIFVIGVLRTEDEELP